MREKWERRAACLERLSEARQHEIRGSTRETKQAAGGDKEEAAKTKGTVSKKRGGVIPL